jgi:hypothetical protein
MWQPIFPEEPKRDCDGDKAHLRDIITTFAKATSRAELVKIASQTFSMDESKHQPTIQQWMSAQHTLVDFGVKPIQQAKPGCAVEIQQTEKKKTVIQHFSIDDKLRLSLAILKDTRFIEKVLFRYLHVPLDSFRC